MNAQIVPDKNLISQSLFVCSAITNWKNNISVFNRNLVAYLTLKIEKSADIAFDASEISDQFDGLISTFNDNFQNYNHLETTFFTDDASDKLRAFIEEFYKLVIQLENAQEKLGHAINFAKAKELIKTKDSLNDVQKNLAALVTAIEGHVSKKQSEIDQLLTVVKKEKKFDAINFILALVAVATFAWGIYEYRHNEHQSETDLIGEFNYRIGATREIINTLYDGSTNSDFEENRQQLIRMVDATDLKRSDAGAKLQWWSLVSKLGDYNYKTGLPPAEDALQKMSNMLRTKDHPYPSNELNGYFNDIDDFGRLNGFYASTNFSK